MLIINEDNTINIMDTQSLPIVPFGKYKGQPVTTLIKDTKYLEWCKQQEWLKTHKVIYNICVNQTITTTDTNSKTPEHNKLQNMFLNEPSQIKLLNILFGGNVDKKFKKKFKFLILDEEFISHFGIIKMPQINRSLKKSKIVFEEKYNWDFILHYFDCQNIMLKTKTDTTKISKDKLYNILKKYKFIYSSDEEIKVFDTYIEENIEDDNYSVYIDTYCCMCNVFCELKPVLSDDYPCVLRKMKTQIEFTKTDKDFNNKMSIKYFDKTDICYIKRKYILIIGNFKSTTTSKEQLIRIFKQSNIHIIFTEEIFDTLQYQQANELLEKTKKQSKTIKDYFGKK